MKFLDEVKVINDDYKDKGIIQGMRGTIIESDVRWNSFYVCFQDQRVYDKDFMKIEGNVFKLNDDICIGIKIKDLEVIQESIINDNDIYDNLPENHKDAWCKVEEGFIINLNGEKKNKKPFHYD